MRTENVKIAAKYIRELEDLESATRAVEKRNGTWIEFEFCRYTFKIERSVVLRSLRDQSEKLKFTIKSLGVED